MRRLLLLGLMIITSPGLLAGQAEDDPKLPGSNLTARQLLIILKTDKEPRRRTVAVSVLDQLGAEYRPALTGALTALKEDTESDVREAAVHTVARLAQKSHEIKEKEKRDRAVESRDLAIEALRQALKSDRAEKVREAAASALGRIGTSDNVPEASLLAAFRGSVPYLTDALKDPHSGTRAAAAEALGRMGSHSREAVPALIDTFKDRKADRFVRGFAAMALGRIGGAAAQPAVAPLATALLETDSAPEVRRSAAEALGMLKTEAASAAGPLGQALKDRNTPVRRAAAAALGQIGPEAQTALAALKEAVKDDDKFVRAQVFHVLGGLPQSAAESVPLLVVGMKDQLLEVRLAAIEALGHLGPEAKAAIPALTAATRDSQTVVREAATEALKKVQPGS